jgi:hypothetical protein
VGHVDPGVGTKHVAQLHQVLDRPPIIALLSVGVFGTSGGPRRWLGLK